MSNMELWNSVSKTDPSHTKRVNQRGGFTSIDAHYQVQQATQAFGSAGVGWGYDVEHSVLQVQGGEVFAFADLTLWHKDKQQSFGPIRGTSMLIARDRDGNLRNDADAPKKALTDALTKALSHLGFSADVFLGKFDDNKYVQGLIDEKKHKPGSQVIPKELMASVNGIKNALATGDLSNANECWSELDYNSKKLLWLAPSKGGHFTTKERDIMKSAEFREAGLDNGEAK